MEIFTESQFSACYIHYRRRVRGYILSRVSDREEAEDLMVRSRDGTDTTVPCTHRYGDAGKGYARKRFTI